MKSLPGEVKSMARDCTIVIPTTDRPAMLRNTLASIRRQLAVDRIVSVIVSENAGGKQTAIVCKEFPELPIECLFQDSPLGPGEHVAKLIAMTTAPYVALVCDDDWWAPGHLGVALRELDRNADCSAHLSAHTWCDGEIAMRSGNQDQELLWIAAACPPPQSAWRLEPDTVVALCTLMTPFTFSGLVMRQVCVSPVVGALDAVEHSLLLDRAFFPALAEIGPILYEPSVDTYYRVHAGNYTTDKSPAWLLGLRIRGSSEFQKFATKRGVDVPSTVSYWYSVMSTAGARQLTQRMLSELGFTRAVELGVPRSQALRLVVGTAKRRLGASLRRLFG